MFFLIHVCTDIFLLTYKGYKKGKLKSVFSKSTITVVNGFGKYMVCHTWERLWC